MGRAAWEIVSHIFTAVSNYTRLSWSRSSLSLPARSKVSFSFFHAPSQLHSCCSFAMQSQVCSSDLSFGAINPISSPISSLLVFLRPALPLDSLQTVAVQTLNTLFWRTWVADAQHSCFSMLSTLDLWSGKPCLLADSKMTFWFSSPNFVHAAIPAAPGQVLK